MSMLKDYIFKENCMKSFLRYTVLAEDMIEDNGENVLILEAVLEDAINIKILFERGMKCKCHNKRFIHASKIEEGRLLHFMRKKEKGRGKSCDMVC